jgi:hypothetical protein
MMIDTEKLNAALNNSKVIAVLARFGSEETALTFVLLISFAMLALSAGVQIGLCEAAYAFQPDMSACIPHQGDFVLMPGLPGTPIDYANAWNNANLGMAVGTMGIVLGGVSLWAKGVMRSPA